MASVSVIEPTRKIYSQVRKQSSWVPWGQTSQLPCGLKRQNNEIVALLMQQVVCCQKLISNSNAFLICSLAFYFSKAVFLRFNFYEGLEKALKILFAFKSTFQLLWIFETIDTCHPSYTHTTYRNPFSSLQATLNGMALANCGLMGVKFVVCRLCKINQKLNLSILTSICVHHRHLSYY